MSRSNGSAGLAVGALAGLLVAAPLLRPGYTLSYDQVVVPRQPITTTTLGLDGSVPRAVPTDLIVAAASRVLPADVVQKLVLLLVFVLAGWGVARLVRGRAASAAAALAYTWNAYVAERLVIGHWSLLLGYAILPWAVGAALDARQEPRKLPLVCLWVLAATLCGATAGVIVTSVVVVVLAWRRAPTGLRAAGVVLLAAVAANAVWWLPAVLRPGGIPADVRGVEAFASRADTALGLPGSLLTLGGIWNQAVVPPERGVTGLVVLSVVAVAVAVLLGVRRVAAWWDGAGSAVLLAGLASVVLAAAASVPGLSTLLRLVVLHVAGGGLLRDGQKFLAPAALCVALCVGATTDLLLAGRRPEALVAAVGLAVVPVVTLPGLAWGVAGRLGVAAYPKDWYAVRGLIAQSPSKGDVAVLPWRLYRRFPWNDNRIVLDPAQRFFPRVTLVDDDLPLTSVTVRGEDRRAAAVTRSLGRPTSLPTTLADLGVRFVVVEHHAGVPGDEALALAGQRRLYAGTQLDLYELAGVRPKHKVMPVGAAAGLVACAGMGLLAGGWAALQWHNARQRVVRHRRLSARSLT